MKTYGLPYKGSKDKIADKICSLFPIKENFYDLFMGGGSITHYQLLQNQYKNYYANDFNPLVVKAFDMAIHGKFKNETRWISHEEFDKLKNTDPYIAFCFSFGNDLKSYAYGKDIEPYKKAIHYYVMMNDDSLLKELYPNVNFPICKNEDFSERKMFLQRFMKQNISLFEGVLKSHIENMTISQNINALNQLKNKNYLSRTENMERIERINKNLTELNFDKLRLSSKSYDKIEIKPNSVIYLDPPYKSTNKYEISKDFDYEKFYSWCERQTELCFISEYSMPKDRFTCIAEIEHRSIICANENQSVIERVFLPNHQVKDYTIPSLFDM